jgi:hypothetical protein
MPSPTMYILSTKGLGPSGSTVSTDYKVLNVMVFFNVIVIPFQLTPHNATVAEERQDINEIAGRIS